MSRRQQVRVDDPNLTAEIDGRPCWERMKGERAKAFGAFQIYRDLSMVERSYEKVGLVMAEQMGLALIKRHGSTTLRPPSHLAAHIRKWAQEYHWHQRVEFYDQYMDKVRIEEAKKNNVEMINRHLSIAAMLQSKGMHRLKQLEPEKMDARHVLTYLIEGAKLERLARGEPTEVSERRGSGAEASKNEVDEAVNSARDLLMSRLNQIQERQKEKDAREIERQAAAADREERSNLRLVNGDGS